VADKPNEQGGSDDNYLDLLNPPGPTHPATGYNYLDLLNPPGNRLRIYFCQKKPLLEMEYQQHEGCAKEKSRGHFSPPEVFSNIT
jgi:hypothetical protein